MPIRRYLGSRVFQPDLLQEMGDAFQLLCDFTELDNTDGDLDARRRLVAEAVIAAAQDGATEVEGLFQGGLAHLGVDLAGSASPQGYDDREAKQLSGP